MTKKEKIIEKIKKNKVSIIFALIIFVGLLMIKLCGTITDNYINSENQTQEINKQGRQVIQKVVFTPSLPSSNILYPVESISINLSTLDGLLNEKLVYFNNDETTYLYIDKVNSYYVYYLTNGVNTQGVCGYTYDSVNYTLNLNYNVSDGYLFCIYYNDVNFLNIDYQFLSNEITYITNAMGNIYIGYFENNSAYENGYQQGIKDNEKWWIDNGFYTTDQYDENKELGFIDGKNQVLENPNDYGLYTKEQLDDEKENAYQEGLVANDASIGNTGFKTMMGSIFNAPYTIIHNILNFEIFGINLFNLFSFIFTCGLIIFGIKLFM